jgi:hypothetical protein
MRRWLCPRPPLAANRERPRELDRSRTPGAWPPGMPLLRSTATASTPARGSARRRQPRDPHNPPGSASGDERARSSGLPPPALHGPAAPCGIAGPEPLDVAVALLLQSSSGGIGAVVDHLRRDPRTWRAQSPVMTEIRLKSMKPFHSSSAIMVTYPTDIGASGKAPRQHGTCSTRGREPGLGRP